jgi:hypothetical protein
MQKTGRMVGYVKDPELKLAISQPLLVLNDTSGCFANFWIDYGSDRIEYSDFAPTVSGKNRLKKQEAALERDLLDAGYTKKVVGESSYYCSKEKVRETLFLLIGIGWNVLDFKGDHLSEEISITDEGSRIAVRTKARALLDYRLQMDGVWEGDILYLKKIQIGSLIALLGEKVQWEDKLKSLAEGLRERGGIDTCLVDRSFRGELLPYQQKGLDWLWFLYSWGFSGLLADEMGLGKTVQVLAFISCLRKDLPVLIIAPTSLLFNWRSEIERFIPGRENIELISYTALRLKGDAYLEKEYALTVLDESNAIKTAGTQTAKAVWAVILITAQGRRPGSVKRLTNATGLSGSAARGRLHDSSADLAAAGCNQYRTVFIRFAG